MARVEMILEIGGRARRSLIPDDMLVEQHFDPGAIVGTVCAVLAIVGHHRSPAVAYADMSGDTLGDTAVSEAAFIESSRAFLAGMIGIDGAEIEPDVNLVAAGLVDSLKLLEYFDFIEQMRGEQIPAAAVSFELLSTIRGAYRLLAA